MKKVIAVLVLAFSALLISAQENYENFVGIGQDQGIFFFVNYKDATGKPEYVVFKGARANINKDVMITTFVGNCPDLTAGILADEGTWNGRKISLKVKKPVMHETSEKSAIRMALELVCSKKFGEFS